MSSYTKDMLSSDEKSDIPYVSEWENNHLYNILQLQEEDPFWGDASIFKNTEDIMNEQHRYEDSFQFNPCPDQFVQIADKMISNEEQICYEPSQQSHLPSVKEVDSTQIREQVIDPLQKNKIKSQKNIAGFVTKSSIKMMFKIYSKDMKKKCSKANISYFDFKKYYSETFFKKVYGLESLYEEFYSNRQHQDWKKIFMIYFTKVVRQHYTINAVRIGKMQGTKEDYFRIKNQVLLYIPLSL